MSQLYLAAISIKNKNYFGKKRVDYDENESSDLSSIYYAEIFVV